MKALFKITVALASKTLLLVLFADLPTLGQTRLGLYFTQEELAVWKQRALNGPYKTFGDASPNSPGDWDRITLNAKQFIGTNPKINFVADRWKGPTMFTSGTVDKDMANTPLGKGLKIRDAAFYYLITGEAIYLNKVREELLNYASIPILDFSNKTAWKEGYIRDVQPGFFIAEFMTRLLLCYDYIKDNLSSADKSTINKWFATSAFYFQTNIDLYFESVFRDFRNEDYTLTSYGAAINPSRINNIAYFGHAGIPNLSLFYNNRMAYMAHFVGLVGIMQNNASLKNTTWFFYRDWLKFSVFPDGLIGEYERWGHDQPDLGWAYSGIITTLMIEIADAFARSGEFKFYEYTTLQGLFGSQGGKKSLKLVIDNWLKFFDGTYNNRYGTDEGNLFNTSTTASLPKTDIPYTATEAPDGWTNKPEGALQKVVRRNAFSKGINLYPGWTKNIGVLYNSDLKASLPPQSVPYTALSAVGGWTSKKLNNAAKKIVRTEYDQLGWRIDLVLTTDMYVKNGNPLFRIDGVFEDPYSHKWYCIYDTYISQANLYYQDNNFKQIYTREKSGLPDYPKIPSSPGWVGIGDIFPGVLFMFGQMEDKVQLYPK